MVGKQTENKITIEYPFNPRHSWVILKNGPNTTVYTYKKSKKNHGQHSYEILTYKMDTSETWYVLVYINMTCFLSIISL